jgi:proline iminopeptidase
MSRLYSGEYDVMLNGVRIHYTVQGSGPVMIAHSGGPGTDARFWDDFAKMDDFLTIVMIHPRGSGLSGPAAGDAYLLPDYAADVEPCESTWAWTNHLSWAGRMGAWLPCNLHSVILIRCRN